MSLACSLTAVPARRRPASAAAPRRVPTKRSADWRSSGPSVPTRRASNSAVDRTGERMSPLESRGALDRAGASAFETKSPWDRSASASPNRSGAPDAATPGYDLSSTAAAASSPRNPNHSLGEGSSGASNANSRSSSYNSSNSSNSNKSNSNANSNPTYSAASSTNATNANSNNYSANTSNNYSANSSNNASAMNNSNVHSPPTANTKNPTAWTRSQPATGPSEPRRSLHSAAAASTAGVLGSASTSTLTTTDSSPTARYAGAVESVSSMGDGVGASAAPWQRERVMKTDADSGARSSSSSNSNSNSSSGGKSNSGTAGSAAASGSNALDAAKSELGASTGTHNQHPATHPTQGGTTWGAGKDSDATWSKPQRSMSTEAAASNTAAQNGWDSTLYAGHDGEPISKGEFAQFRNDVMGRIKALEERYKGAAATPAPKRDD